MRKKLAGSDRRTSHRAPEIRVKSPHLAPPHAEPSAAPDAPDATEPAEKDEHLRRPPRETAPSALNLGAASAPTNRTV